MERGSFGWHLAQTSLGQICHRDARVPYELNCLLCEPSVIAGVRTLCTRYRDKYVGYSGVGYIAVASALWYTYESGDC